MDKLYNTVLLYKVACIRNIRVYTTTRCTTRCLDRLPVFIITYGIWKVLADDVDIEYFQKICLVFLFAVQSVRYWSIYGIFIKISCLVHRVDSFLLALLFEFGFQCLKLSTV